MRSPKIAMFNHGQESTGSFSLETSVLKAPVRGVEMAGELQGQEALEGSIGRIL
jgi:hypothetical protein